ncbi:MAG: tryptophan--tRNA ligase [bacterium]|nr:tryptophan--tRNA ligase [bacterium]
MKPILLSGIQPTGPLHLGNYLGALKNFVELQNSNRYQGFFFIADLHSLTENFQPKEKAADITNVFADYLAAGLKPEKSVMFLQSAISAHAELAILLNNFTPFGELRRMTQFKDKSENQSDNINVGLFEYPVLMAADVLLYDTQFVPVGDDQLQHLELTRTLARKFNSRFGQTFYEPKPLLTEVPRLMSLDQPDKKMSKSRPAGCLFLDDAPMKIREKIQRAITDSGREIIYDPKKKQAISNLILIYTAFTGMSVKEIEKKFAKTSYVEFKKELAETVVKGLSPFQKKKKAILANPKKITALIKKGNKQAAKIANKKIDQVKKKLGLVI